MFRIINTQTIGFKMSMAFTCLIVVLLIQGGFAVYSENNISAAHRKALENRLNIEKVIDEYRQLRLTVFKLLGTSDPDIMDTLKTEIAQAITDITAHANTLNLQHALLTKSLNTYQQVTDLHWQFKTSEAYTLINATSQTEYEELQQFFETNTRDLEVASQHEVSQIRTLITWMIFAICAVSVVVALVWSRYLSRSIATPITHIVNVAQRVSTGDLSMNITVTRKDELGQLQTAMKNMLTATLDITHLAEEMAQGNLTLEVKERSDKDTLMQALKAMLHRLQDVVVSVKVTSDHLASVGQEISSGAGRLSEGTAQQAASTEEASASMQEMAATIRQNADNAGQTEKIALQAVEYAEEGSKVVAETVIVMKQIAQKIMIIEDIAMQTRLLSLNATIEAARAQEYGKAFSVVASEVRQLSDVTKKAAEEIKQLATTSLVVSEKAGQMLTTLVPSIRRTTELVQEISAASKEQSAGADQVNAAIQQLDHVSQLNVPIAEAMATTSEELAAQARQLQHTIAFFNIAKNDVMLNDAKEAMPIIRKTSGMKSTVRQPAYNESKPAKNAETTSFPRHPLDMAHPLGYNDEHDQDFERY